MPDEDRRQAYEVRPCGPIGRVSWVWLFSAVLDSLLNCRSAAAAEEGQQHSEAEPRATVRGHRQGVVLGRQGP